MINRNTRTFGALAIFLALTANIAYANSSWRWFAGTPLTILPWVVVITLVVEIAAIRRINQMSAFVKPAVVITAANVLSFLTPYVFLGLMPPVFMEHLSFFERIEYEVDYLPFYIVGIFFLLLTLAVELPVVYNVLKKDVADKKRLLLSVAAVNFATTLGVAVAERIICPGRW